ncbi:helix-turn-helix domain-containing protein [Kibdelosporangium philippinense]|uniref:Helix-turn-helix domain-containing protein n=2 Tax=Kibdelosporangium philippinense TaxID=211113 RepID=A0ABS8ZIW7_9PSEU|nr:helix-turn-helix domain-containing protein [Kibdelosporangium philippinense]MCE7007063.1 helix-turn-helix domain-containing protein [Kibdelosporangium philippinense]MCE7007125.1 helix-turn-helix domain-containing protein [Kibdelosporangium philippinense]
MTLAEAAELPTVVDLVTAARALGVGRTTAYALARQGKFPCSVYQVGGSYRVPTMEVLRLLGLVATDSGPI